MKRNFWLKLVIVTTVLLTAMGCSDSLENESGDSLYCTTSASVVSGDINASYTSVTLSNLVVYIYNGEGDYTLTLPSGSSVSSSSSTYSSASSFVLTTGVSGGISSSVSVVDDETGDSASCELVISATSTTSGVVSITSSPSTSTTKGGYFTVTATASSVVSPQFSYSQSSTYPSYVSISTLSNGVVSVTSSVAQTVVLTATMISNSSGVASSSSSITLTFTETTSSTTTLSCSLSHNAGTYYRGQYVTFFITSNTGEALKLIYWEPGEAWNYPPTFPITLPMYSTYAYFNVAYDYSGVKNVRVIAESVSRPGVFCNGGGYLSDSVTIY